jgi:hypothetical protein
MAVKIDIGVACSGAQDPQWVTGLLAELLAEVQVGGLTIGGIRFGMTALPDVNKNCDVADPREHDGPAPAHEKRRNELTDSNRVKIARGFLGGDADYLWFLDDDTVPPKGALSSLLSLGKPFVGGLYFLGKPPYSPIAYRRAPDGLYAPIYHYGHGALLPVDSIGMGCTLIHRSVFETIMAEHRVYERPNGSLVPVHQSLVGACDVAILGKDAPDVFTANGYLHTKLRPWADSDNRPWPFFALEYGRTEDHHFCELAANVGLRPFVDTTIVCKHIKPRAIDRDDYRAAAEKVEIVA